MSRFTEIPPNMPVNPFPRPESTKTQKAGITADMWDEFLEVFLDQHPGYLPGNWIAPNIAFKGELHKVWNEVQSVRKVIMDDHVRPNYATRFRHKIRNMVAKAGRIENAVCLGLGQVYTMGSTASGRDWIEQCGMFFALCQAIEEKQGMSPGTLPKVFQDPAFKLEERFVLETLGKQTVVYPPAANSLMKVDTFVYAPHFPANRMFGTFFGRGVHPEILLTNDLGGEFSGIGAAIAQHYIENVYWTRNSTVDNTSTSMYNEASKFFKTHDGIWFDGLYSNYMPHKQVLAKAFRASRFYVRKRNRAAIESS